MSWMYEGHELPRFYGTRLWHPVYRFALKIYGRGAQWLTGARATVERQHPCPLCRRGSRKAIFAGFPVRLCEDLDCRCLFGFWSWVPGNLFPFNGWLMLYAGSYPRALWAWFRAFRGEESES